MQMFMVMCLLGDAQQQLDDDIQILQTSAIKFSQFVDQVINMTYNKAYDLMTSEGNVYTDSFFQEQTIQLKDKIESLMINIDRAGYVMSQFQEYCLQDEIKVFQNKMFGPLFVNLSSYQSNSPNICKQNLTLIERGYNLIFPLDDVDKRYTNLYSQMYYGNENTHLVYPYSQELINFTEQFSKFQQMAETIIIPINFDLKYISANITERLFVRQEKITKFQVNNHNNEDLCDLVCESLTNYLKIASNEQQGRNIIVYNSSNYFSFSGQSIYGNSDLLFEAYMQIVQEKQKSISNPAIEDILELTLVHINHLQEKYQENKQIFTRQEIFGSDKQYQLIHLFFPDNANVIDQQKYESVLNKLKNEVLQLQNIQINLVYLSNSGPFVHQLANILNCTILYIDKFVTLPDKLVEYHRSLQQKNLFKYALKYQVIDGISFLIISKMVDEKLNIITFLIPLETLIQSRCNIQIISGFQLLNSIDNHIIYSNLSQDLQVKYYNLDLQIKVYLMSKYKSCYKSSDLYVCIQSLDQISQLFLIQVTLLSDLPFIPYNTQFVSNPYLASINPNSICMKNKDSCDLVVLISEFGMLGLLEFGNQSLYGFKFNDTTFNKMISVIVQFNMQPNFYDQQIFQDIGISTERINSLIATISNIDKFTQIYDQIILNISENLILQNKEIVHFCQQLAIFQLTCVKYNYINTTTINLFALEIYKHSNNDQLELEFFIQCDQLFTNFIGREICILVCFKNKLDKNIIGFQFLAMPANIFLNNYMVNFDPLFMKIQSNYSYVQVQSQTFVNITLDWAIAQSYLFKYGFIYCDYEITNNTGSFQAKFKESFFDIVSFKNDEVIIQKYYDKIFILQVNALKTNELYECQQLKTTIVHDIDQTFISTKKYIYQKIVTPISSFKNNFILEFNFIILSLFLLIQIIIIYVFI